MEFVDYYKILGLNKNATEAEIKKAYRKFARKHHPDLNPNDEAAHSKFQKINEANEVLSDPEKRKKYDQYGKDWQHADAYEQAKQQQNSQSYGRKSAGGQGFGGGQGFDDSQFSDFFESMFGGGGSRNSGRRQSAAFKGQDVTATLRLNLTDVLKTQKQTVSVGGKNIRFTIPAGVEDGQNIRIKGYGGEGSNGGPKGDLFIKFEIFNNTEFKRVGNDLYKTQDIDIYQAVLGGEITLETLDGAVKLKLKPETQNNTKVKLTGKGMPKYKKEDHHGDLFITYNVLIPKNLSDKEVDLFTQLSKLRQ